MGSYSWDTTPSGVNDGYGYNIWETKTTSTPKSSQDSTTKADVNRLLNEWYLGEEDSNNLVACYKGPSKLLKDCPNDSKTLKTGVGGKDLIDDAVWNLGGIDCTNANGYKYLPILDTYNKERGTLTGNGFGEVAMTKWTGKVELPYVTDFTYASTNYECRSGARAGVETDSYKCKKELGNWTNNGSSWTLSPHSGNATSVFDVYIDSSSYSDYACSVLGVRPAVYLKSVVRITGNNGSSSSPYILSI